MTRIVAVLFLLLVVSVRLNYCDGLLECKWGDSKLNSSMEYDTSENKTCPENSVVCAAIICTKAGDFSQISWLCLPDKLQDWVGIMKDVMYENFSKTDLVRIECKCVFGEEGKNLSNVNFKRPALPMGLQCLYGETDAYGIGELNERECLVKDHYCFNANCAEGNGQIVHSVWGCSPDIDCVALTAKVGKAFKASVNCDCTYGERDTDFSITKLTTTTTTTKKATTVTTTTTTSTKKPTTTKTTKPTTSTTTTTTKKPTTTNGSVSSTGQSANMTSEANLSVRRSCASFWNLLMMIGILAATPHSMGVM